MVSIISNETSLGDLLTSALRDKRIQFEEIHNKEKKAILRRGEHEKLIALTKVLSIGNEGSYEATLSANFYGDYSIVDLAIANPSKDRVIFYTYNTSNGKGSLVDSDRVCQPSPNPQDAVKYIAELVSTRQSK